MLSDVHQIQQAQAEGDGELALATAQRLSISAREDSVEDRHRWAENKEAQDRSERALQAGRRSSQQGLHAPEESQDGTLPLRYTVAARRCVACTQSNLQPCMAPVAGESARSCWACSQAGRVCEWDGESEQATDAGTVEVSVGDAHSPLTSDPATTSDRKRKREHGSKGKGKAAVSPAPSGNDNPGPSQGGQSPEKLEEAQRICLNDAIAVLRVARKSLDELNRTGRYIMDEFEICYPEFWQEVMDRNPPPDIADASDAYFEAANEAMADMQEVEAELGAPSEPEEEYDCKE